MGHGLASASLPFWSGFRFYLKVNTLTLD